MSHPFRLTPCWQSPRLQRLHFKKSHLPFNGVSPPSAKNSQSMFLPLCGPLKLGPGRDNEEVTSWSVSILTSPLWPSLSSSWRCWHCSAVIEAGLDDTLFVWQHAIQCKDCYSLYCSAVFTETETHEGTNGPAEWDGEWMGRTIKVWVWLYIDLSNLTERDCPIL